MQVNTLRNTLLAIAMVSLSNMVSANTIWTDWTSINGSSATGSLNGVSVTATGTFLTSRSQTECGTNWWTEPNAADPAYTGGDLNLAPTNCEQIGLDRATSVNITFDSAIDSLYMGLLSIGRTGTPITYDFVQSSFTVNSEGQGYWGNDSTVYGPGSQTILTMREFHGVLLFDTPVTSLTFTTSSNEFWHAFTFGTTTNVSAPTTILLFSLSLFGLLFFRRGNLIKTL